MTDAVSCQNFAPGWASMYQNHSFLRFTGFPCIQLRYVLACHARPDRHSARSVRLSTRIARCPGEREGDRVSDEDCRIPGHSRRPFWNGAWLKLNTNARGAGNGTTPLWMNPQAAASNTWRTARSAANP